MATSNLSMERLFSPISDLAPLSAGRSFSGESLRSRHNRSVQGTWRATSRHSIFSDNKTASLTCIPRSSIIPEPNSLRSVGVSRPAPQPLSGPHFLKHSRLGPCQSSATSTFPSDGGQLGSGSQSGGAGVLRLLSTIVAIIRALAFYTYTLTLSVPLFIIMLLLTPIEWLTDRVRRRKLHFVNDLWANVSTWPFFRVEIVGKENLPGPDQPAVYTANHLSYMDIYSLFALRRPFKYISKLSNFLIPIVGWSMFLTGHISLKRTDTRSQIDCLKTCVELLKTGSPVLFFPEGTRSKDGRLHGFKKGAFSVAAKAGVPVIPITLIGTADVMPNGKEWSMFPARVRIVVHPPVTSKNADELKERTFAAIASPLPPALISAGSADAED